MQVESKLRFSISASADNARNTASNVPPSRHLANRAYTDCHGPYTSGSSRHCAPLWAIQSIPLSIFLSSFRGRPRCPVPSGGSIAFTRSHCSFVNSYRFMSLFSHTYPLCAIFIFQTRPSLASSMSPSFLRIVSGSNDTRFGGGSLFTIPLKQEPRNLGTINKSSGTKKVPFLRRRTALKRGITLCGTIGTDWACGFDSCRFGKPPRK